MSFMFVLFRCVGFARVGSIFSHIIDDIDIDCETHPHFFDYCPILSGINKNVQFKVQSLLFLDIEFICDRYY